MDCLLDWLMTQELLVYLADWEQGSGKVFVG